MFDFAELKKFFLFNLIGSLIVAALVAVVIVLIGEFNEVTGKVFLTLLMVVIHSLVSLGFIWDDEKQNTFERLAFFINILFILIILSFITSIFGVWNIITGEMIIKIYSTYFVLAFASLHGDILSKALNKESYLDTIIFVNYLFMIAVVAMLQPVIYIEESTRVLGEVFFRILAAVGIIDGTLSILTIIFYKIHIHKYPKEENPLQGKVQQGESSDNKKKGLSSWVWVLIIFLGIQILLSIVSFFIGSIIY